MAKIELFGDVFLCNRYDELEKKLRKDINNKFSSGRKLSDSFGRWNK